MAKLFIPATAGMTKEDIHSFMYMSDGDGLMYNYITLGYETLPLFTADEIPDKIAQDFVNEEYTLSCEGMGEEDFNSARRELVGEMYRKVKAALKR